MGDNWGRSARSASSSSARWWRTWPTSGSRSPPSAASSPQMMTELMTELAAVMTTPAGCGWRTRRAARRSPGAPPSSSAISSPSGYSSCPGSDAPAADEGRGADMRWELSPEQEMFRDSFREWLAAYAATATVRQWLSDDDVGPFEARLAAEGWLGAGFSEEAGGQGGGLLELALAAEQLGYAAAPGGSWLASVLAIPALAGQPERTEEG